VTSGGPELWKAPYMPEFNRFLGRMSYLLQHGRHVADVAVLYPSRRSRRLTRMRAGSTPCRRQTRGRRSIASICRAKAVHANGDRLPGDWGSVVPRSAGGFHLRAPRGPGGAMHGRGKETGSQQPGEPRGVQCADPPGGDTLSVAAAARIKEFYDQGGAVIASSKLPRNRRSSEKTRRSRRWWARCSACR